MSFKLFLFASFVLVGVLRSESKTTHAVQRYQSYVFREQDIELWWIAKTVFIKESLASLTENLNKKNEESYENLTRYSKEQTSIMSRHVLDLQSSFSLYKDDTNEELEQIKKTLVTDVEALKTSLKHDLHHFELRLAFRLAYYNNKFHEFIGKLSDCHHRDRAPTEEDVHKASLLSGLLTLDPLL